MTHRWSGHVGFVAAVLVALCALWAGPSRAADEPFTGELDLVLRKALFHDPAKVDDRHANLVLYLQADEGRWHDVWGKAQNFTIGEHRGLVESATITDDAVRLKVRMVIHGDFWIKGRWFGAFELNLKRGEDGELTGAYDARFKGVEYSGEVDGRLLPRRSQPEGFARPAPDEHPRVLFRQSDRPRLRKKLQTPLGKAYREAVKASPDPINLGVLYQLTGDKAYAERARKSIAAQYDREIPVFGFGSGGFGHDIFKTLVAYDLCVDAWPADFNRWLRKQFEAFTERHQYVLMTSHANFHPCSNYYGPGRGVPGVASMVLWGDKGEKPDPPRDPIARAWPVAPPEDFEPGKGVSVVDFKPGQTPTRWIWTGLLSPQSSRDLLTTLGGYEKARPEVGSRSQYLVRTNEWFKRAILEFKPLPEKLSTDKGVAVGKATETGAGSVSVYFTALKVEAEQVLRPVRGRDDLRMWLSGRELEDGKFYRVKPGVHPMLVQLRAEDKTAGTLGPTLQPVDESSQNPVLGLYRLDRALWEKDMQRWEQTGMSAERHLWLSRAWWQNMQHYRWGVGDGGFFAETGGYAGISSWYPSVYASMYPNFHGREVSPYPDIDHVMPRFMMQAVFPQGGGARIAKLNSAVRFDAQWMACHFPTIPEIYKPAALWAWNRLAGFDGSDYASLFRDRKGHHGGVTLAQTFLHYPLDMAAAHPADVMPRSWDAPTFGFYVNRSGFRGGDDFVAQVFAKAAPVVGWNHPNAGAIRIAGLGHNWTDAPGDRNGTRPQYSVVLLPEDEGLNIGSCGRVLHRHAAKDGSGSLTIDLGDVYAKRSKDLYDSMFFRHPEALRPSGITGLRAFGFDYSGRSGAPALVVIVDRIDGGGRKLWTWQRPGGAKVSIGEQAFTLRQGEASMHATFVTPGRVKIESASDAVQIGTERKGFHGTLHRIKATGGDSYFVVMTFQNGDPPKVSVEGEGLDAEVTVGGQTVRFDGQKVIFGS